jgi:long-chain acyl-CoA synthetase
VKHLLEFLDRYIRGPSPALVYDNGFRRWSYSRLEVDGLDELRALDGPVVFASNHQSHFDTPVILTALPGRWRRTIAIAMWKEYFDAHFQPAGHTLRDRLATRTVYYLVTGLFNAFPLPQTEPGARQTLRYMGELVTNGFSILISSPRGRAPSGVISIHFSPASG